MVNGKPIIHVKSSQFGEVHSMNSKLIIGSFVDRRPEFRVVKDIVTQTWKLTNKFTMKPYGDQSFSFKFPIEEARATILSMESFHIDSQLFVVRPFAEADLRDLMLPV